jgi:SAM-dependent methyltransferase
MLEREAIETQIGQLSQSVRKLALVGAALKIRKNSDVDPRLRGLIAENLNFFLGNAINDLADHEASTLIGMIDMGFSEAGELLSNAARAGWQVVDPLLLQTQGRLSGHVFQRIRSLATDRPLMQQALAGRFLDVGTGVAGIALEAAKSCPSLIIDGIDIWEPALALARSNVENSPYADRISIRHLDVTKLPEEARYTLVWLPTMFMKRSAVEAALDHIAAASLPNAYVIAARYTIPEDPEAAAFVALRTYRSGGEPIAQADMEEILRLRNFVEVESDTSPLATLTLGRRS